MQIHIITVWYNEAAFAPLFLQHYAWADSLTVLLDDATCDDTLHLLDKSPGATVAPVSFPDGMDDELKVRYINKAAQQLGSIADWLLVVDADEFVFHPEQSVHEYLAASSYDIESVPFWQMYRHASEQDIVPHLPPLQQRTHGDPRLGWCFEQGHFTKPIAVRVGVKPAWQPGNHYVDTQGGSVCQSPALRGCHWAMADVNIAIDRRIKGRKERMSHNNFSKGLTSHNWHITEQSIRDECAQHCNDPEVVTCKKV